MPAQCADAPAFGVIQPQDLRLQMTRDHAGNPDARGSALSAPLPAPRTRPPRQRRATQRAHADLGEGSSCAKSKVRAVRIGQFRVGCQRFRYAAVTAARGTALMRHFLPPTHPPPPLPGGMTMRSPAAALIARCGSTTGLAPADPRAFTRTVNVAVIAAAANAHLHRTTPAVIEPITRLAQFPHRPLPKRWTAPGQGRHKGPAQWPIPGTAHRGLGGSDVNLETLGPRFCYLSPASISQSLQRASTPPNQQPELLPPSAADHANPREGKKNR